MDLGLIYMDWKLRHRSKTFMRVQDSKGPFWSSNCNNNREVRICPATQILFNVQTISQVLEVQMHSFLFYWKAETMSQNFHEDYLFKLWYLQWRFVQTRREGLSPSQDVATHSTISYQINSFKFWPIKKAFAMHLGILVFRSISCSCSLSLYFCNV
jgi:hypothetical protein